MDEAFKYFQMKGCMYLCLGAQTNTSIWLCIADHEQHSSNMRESTVEIVKAAQTAKLVIRSSSSINLVWWVSYSFILNKYLIVK